MLILSALKESNKHGYEISVFIESQSERYFKMSFGTMYPILHNLEKNKYIKGLWSEGTSKRKKKTYKITSSGKQYHQKYKKEIDSFFNTFKNMTEDNNEDN